MTTPQQRKPAAPTQSQQLTSPYTGEFAGVEPGAISAQPFFDYMSQVKELALDPREEIRQRESDILQEKVQAQQAAMGLLGGEGTAGSGVGLQAVGEALGDFGLDWQNQQLARAGAGGQTLYSLGGLGQNIAQAGFSNAMDLGASQFEYEPEIQQYAPPSVSYTHSPGAGGGGGRFGGAGLAAYKAARQARQTTPQNYIPSTWTNPRTTAPGRGWTY